MLAKTGSQIIIAGCSPSLTSPSPVLWVGYRWCMLTFPSQGTRLRSKRVSTKNSSVTLSWAFRCSRKRTLKCLSQRADLLWNVPMYNIRLTHHAVQNATALHQNKSNKS